MERLSPQDLVGLELDAVDLSTVGPPAGQRKRPPKGVVIHTPGGSYVERCGRTAKSDSDEDIDDEVARRFDGRKYRPGYLVGQSGRIYILDGDDRRTWHAGTLSRPHYDDNWSKWAKPLRGSGWQRHGRRPWTVYDWFADRYGRVNPAEVFPWGRSPNDAIGVDVRPSHLDGSFSAAQHAALRRLVAALADLHGFPVDDRHVVTHSFAAPLERGSVLRRGRVIGTHWDPPLKKFNYSEILGSP